MSRYTHQLVGYGVGAVAFLSLGIAADRDAVALPFVSQIHAIPVPPKTYVFDQRTKGGYPLASDKRCATHTRILVRSEQPLKTLQKHYNSHPIDAAHGKGKVVPTVQKASEAGDMAPRWKNHRSDPTVFVIDFRSPGTPGTEAVCGL